MLCLQRFQTEVQSKEQIITHVAIEQTTPVEMRWAFKQVYELPKQKVHI